MMTSLDRERGDTRRARLALARPQVPAIVSTFMPALVSASRGNPREASPR